MIRRTASAAARRRLPSAFTNGDAPSSAARAPRRRSACSAASCSREKEGEREERGEWVRRTVGGLGKERVR
eukprot:3910040-Pleurochrysis_carterae.AAC.2